MADMGMGAHLMTFILAASAIAARANARSLLFVVVVMTVRTQFHARAHAVTLHCCAGSIALGTCGGVLVAVKFLPNADAHSKQELRAFEMLRAGHPNVISALTPVPTPDTDTTMLPMVRYVHYVPTAVYLS